MPSGYISSWVHFFPQAVRLCSARRSHEKGFKWGGGVVVVVVVVVVVIASAAVAVAVATGGMGVEVDR